MKHHNHKKIYRISVSALCMALGLVLPFLTGQIPEIGNMLLPMHLPVFLCGILCGAPYGAVVGFVTPLLRSLLFSRPVLYPNALSMAFELAAYGILIALFAALLRKKTVKTLCLALVGAMLGGRVIWALTRIVFLAVGDMPFSWAIFFTEGFVTAFPGILVQLVMIPALTVAIDPDYRASFKKKTQLTVAKHTTDSAVLDIVQRLVATLPDEKRLTVAIEGRAASGKTTLSQALKRRLDEMGIVSLVVHTDDHLLPFALRTAERMAKVGGHFDSERLKNEILLPFSEGAPVTVRPYRCHSDSFSEEETFSLPEGAVLIVEGAYSMHPSLETVYDLTVFCEVDRSVQRDRILARNKERADAFFTEWIPREEEYFAAIRPDLSADLRILMNG